MYQAAIAHCESVKDFVTREILVHIQKSEEEHIDFIEEQLGLIEKMGLPNYVQSATGELEGQPIRGEVAGRVRRPREPSPARLRADARRAAR